MKTTSKLILSLAALSLAACSSEDAFNMDDLKQKGEEQAKLADVPVSFGSYIGTAGGTRAGATGEQTTSKLQTYGFGVFAYNTKTSSLTSGTAFDTYKPDFMWNQKVTYQSSNWTYTPVKYWPNGIDAANFPNSPSNSATEEATQYLSFFAYAPYADQVELNSTTYTLNPTTGEFENGSNNYSTQDGASGILKYTHNSTAGDPKVTYKLASSRTLSENVDLLWGTRGQATYIETDGTPNTAELGTYNVNLTKQTVQERVKFLFKHALAKFGGLKVVADIDGNSSSPGTAGFGTKPDETLITLNSLSIKDKSGTIGTGGEFDLATGTWSVTSTLSDGTELFDGTGGTNVMNDKVWEPSSTPVWETNKWTTPDGGVLSSELRDVYSTYDPLLFIPGATAPQLTVVLSYTVRTYDTKLDPATASNNEGTWSKVTQTITNSITFPAALDPNKSYTLVMHIGLTSVKFSAEVSGWDDAATTEVIWLPSNVVNYTDSREITATTTSETFDFSSYDIGDYSSATKDNTVVTDVSVSGTTATLTIAANTGTTKRNGSVTIIGTKGSVTLNLTQDAGALTVSGTGANSGVTSFSVADAGSNAQTITKAMISIKDGENDVEFTTDNNSNVTSITFGTELTTGKSYVITVKVNDATGTMTVNYQ